MKARTLSMIVCITMILACGLVALAQEASAVPVEVKPVIEVTPTKAKPLVQMAILLDTSGSMTGLIDQARTELWSIVNEFIFARRGGVQPEVQVALYEYGKSSLPGEEGYLRQIVPLTTDLDKISEELFALKTNGGSEYCGWVIKEAAEGLQWSKSPDDLKVIFIAGNEPFTQGPIDYKKACKLAVTKGVVVNTVHCGPERQGIDGMWKDGAVVADGRYLNIDHNRQIVHIPAPQDKEIAVLGKRLNETYIPYGHRGRALQERQMTQDTNAAVASPEAAVQRAVTKSSANYSNTGWDLVDAVNAGQVDLAKVKSDKLTEKMQKMTPAERKAYVESQAKQRAELQAKIQKLNEQRRQFIAEEMKKRQGGEETLGSAVKQAIRQQAGKKNFQFQSSNSTLKSDPNDSQS